MRKVCIVVGSRANYSSIKSLMAAVQGHADLELQVVAMASALSDRYGAVYQHILKDGFPIDARVNMLLEGETPTTMAKSTGLGLLELPSVFDHLEPDVVVTVGDRFETIATAVAAAFMNIPLAHTMGGEVTGTIDESIRHAISKFAHIHFPASEDARERIIRLGEDPETVHMVGCPRIDLVAGILNNARVKSSFSPDNLGGVGDPIDWDKPFLLISQHPVTTEFGDGKEQILNTLKAASHVGMQALVLWPNSDAGADDIARGIRTYREMGLAVNMHFCKNLPVDTYIHMMDKTACLVGNSSSGIREGAYIGTPVVNVGSRQDGRERGQNVLDVGYGVDQIESAIRKQVSIGKYSMDPIYGDGTAGERIADILSFATFKIQKQITY
ncbi:UDP-N-acetylglucosamine 2-epimerase [Thalassospira sp. GO-4]|uniref:UDP-N-acetylglucosamine 2-epimerase n=1 Tax=Thalassospira sp. GO-4 TaxID=2946605 RepID=UPI00211331BE|nr:UDP-N-acetylglucosamine 2-epimerase [Thalassospira sp. GO-4]